MAPRRHAYPRHPFFQWRRAHKLTQGEMAKKIGAEQARVSRFECGAIERLEPEQAAAAEKVSRGRIKRDHCLFDTPAMRMRLDREERQ